MGGKGGINLVHYNTSCFSLLETKSALRNHKTQAQCVVSSPTAAPFSYPPIRKTKKKKASVFCLPVRQSQDCSSCGFYKDRVPQHIKCVQ